MMHADMLIRGGTVVDPSRNFQAQADVLIRNDKIVEISPQEDVQAEKIIDATGCLVLPGLIDNHAHVFYGGSAVSCDPDVTLLPMGVTTVVDPGSAGVDTAEAFLRSVIRQSRMKIFCSLNVSSEGMTTRLHSENLNPKFYNRDRLGYFLRKYPDVIKGLKIRCGAELVEEFGISALAGALEVAASLGSPLTVHVTNPPCELGDLALMLRRGDTLCHVYHGIGDTIINENGRVKEKIHQARRNGVMFDTADARKNHSLAITRLALADGLLPDIISTDLTEASVFGDMVFGLPVMMSKYLALGMPLLEVVRACTATPAALLGLAGTLGSLAAGATADVAIVKLVTKDRTLPNGLGESMVIPKLFVPQMTILDGQVVFRQVDFC